MRPLKMDPGAVLYGVMGWCEVKGAAAAHPDWALVSITEHGRPARSFPNHAGPYLSLAFDDYSKNGPHYDAMRRSDAVAVVAFARTARETDGLLVHCAAGISRSSAVLLGVLAARSTRDPIARLDDAVAYSRERGWRDETPVRPNIRCVALLDAVIEERDGIPRGLLEAVWRRWPVADRTIDEVRADALEDPPAWG